MRRLLIAMSLLGLLVAVGRSQNLPPRSPLQSSTTALTIPSMNALVILMYCRTSITRDEWEPCPDLKQGEEFLGRLPDGEALLYAQGGFTKATIPPPIHFPLRIDKGPWADRKGNVR